MNLYQQNIIDHYKHPKNKGTLENVDFIVYEVNTLCGDGLKFFIKLNSSKDEIEDIKFDGEGCAISQAAASMLTEEIKGMSIEEFKKIDKEYILELLGVDINPSRLKCALLSLECFKKVEI